MRNLHQEITARVLAALQAGTVIWRQPWGTFAASGMPKNAITGRAYSGANVPLLWLTAQERGYTVNSWLTFNQAKEVGASVRKGEKSTLVIFVSSIEKIDEETGKPGRVMFYKGFNVFNVAQVDNLPAKYLGESAQPLNYDERDALADAFMVSTGAKISHDGGSRAFYRPSTDSIHLPAWEAFNNRAAALGTIFHELGHWSGHETRLNRTFGKRFGDSAYAAEELTAEMTSAFLCAEFGYDNSTIDQTAAYIDYWSKFLSDPKNEKAFVAACSAASKAVDFMRGLALAEDEQPCMASA